MGTFICSVLKVFFIVTAFIHLYLTPAHAQETPLKHAPDVLPGVEPQMLTADYWIRLQDDADKVIMTPLEIEHFNAAVRSRQVILKPYFGKPNPLERDFLITEIKGPVMNPLVPLELPDTLPGDSLRVRLVSNIEWLYSRNFFDSRGAVYNESMLQEIVNTMNVNAVPDTIIRRFGIIVNHGNIRHYPTSVPGFANQRLVADFFKATGICLGNPVAVIHESPDGDYLYIESPISRGWISAKDIAFAERSEIKALAEDDSFLMATGHKIPIYGDPLFKSFNRYFYFSAAVPLIRHDSKGYVVEIASRQPDGTLGVHNGYIGPDADVHIGYLSYTKRNILDQTFKLLNQPYGWADQLDKRDCSGTQRVIHRCFGIITGRHPSFILSSTGHQVFINPELSVEEKMAEASNIEPVITVAGTSGHIVRFLGKAHNGKLYFIHQAGWDYKDENGEQFKVGRMSVNAADHNWYHINSAKVFTTIRP